MLVDTIVLLLNNTQLHSVGATQSFIEEFGWEQFDVIHHTAPICIQICLYDFFKWYFPDMPCMLKGHLLLQCSF